MNNFAELQLLTKMEFSFNNLPRWFSIASLIKRVSEFAADVLFVRKKPFSRKYLLKRTPRRTKILISSNLNKIFKIWDMLFEFIQIEIQCSKNYVKIFLPQESGAFRNNIEKPLPKLKKYACYISTDNICSVCNPM